MVVGTETTTEPIPTGIDLDKTRAARKTDKVKESRASRVSRARVKLKVLAEATRVSRARVAVLAEARIPANTGATWVLVEEEMSAARTKSKRAMRELGSKNLWGRGSWCRMSREESRPETLGR